LRQRLAGWRCSKYRDRYFEKCSEQKV
jgi:hypothetical protein